MKGYTQTKTAKRGRRQGAAMIAGGAGWAGLAADDAIGNLAKGIRKTPLRGKIKAGLALATIPGSAYMAYQGYKKYKAHK